MEIKELGRRLGVGSLLLHLYHRPISQVRSMVAQGGPIAIRATEKSRLAMVEAAKILPPLPVPHEASALRVQMLTGTRFWYQTAWCLHTFVRNANEAIGADVHDDGTLSGECLEYLQRLGPAIRIYPIDEAVARLDQNLPVNRFPTLRALWKDFFLIRKLTDIHAGRSGWRLFIDSDLLFFSYPETLLGWMRAPERPLVAVDCIESYGYSRDLMRSVCGREIPRLVNTGLCGLDSSAIDWDEIEFWSATLIAKAKRHYFLEQALVAMLVAKYPAHVAAPADSYLTMPGRDEVMSPRAVMHHYVANSKRWYFGYGWQNASKRASREPI